MDVLTQCDAPARSARLRLSTVADAWLATRAQNWPCIEERLDIQCSPYTMTRDQYFVLGEIPDMPQVIVFSGGCGRAFKFGPLLGQCLADLALGKEPSYDIAPLSPSRPAVGLQVTPVTPHTASLSPAAAARRAAVQRDLARTA